MGRKPRTKLFYASPELEAEELALARYLINDFPFKRNYSKALRGLYSQLHDTRREGGNFVGLDGAGYLALDHKFLKELDGIPWVRFKEALELIRSLDDMTIPGKCLLGALEYYQYRQRWRARGFSKASYAARYHTSPATLYRWMRLCVSWVYSEVMIDKKEPPEE